MTKKYIVNLTEAKREALLALTKKGSLKARKLTRAHILLQADAGATDAALTATVHVGTATVEPIRKRFVEGNLEGAFSERPQPGARPNSTAKAKPPWSLGHALTARQDQGLDHAAVG